MNNSIKIAVFCIFTALSATSYAQTLEAAIASEVAHNVKFLDLESDKYFVPTVDYPDNEPMVFTFNGKRVIKKDVDADGIQDGVALLYYCEEMNCHATTESVDLVVFKGLGKGQYTKLGSVAIGLTAELNSIKNGVIRVNSYSYADNDPLCCPSEKTTTSYKIQYNRLVKID